MAAFPKYTENDFKLYLLLRNMQEAENGDKKAYEQTGFDLLDFLNGFPDDQLPQMMKTVESLDKDVRSAKIVMLSEQKTNPRPTSPIDDSPEP